MGDPSFPYESCQPLWTQPCKCSHHWSLSNGCWTWVYFWLVSFTLQTLRRSMLFFLGKGVVICYIDSDIVEWKNCYKYQEAKRCLTVIYRAWDAVFYHQMKHREESWKYDAKRSIFWRTSMCFIWWWNTVSNYLYYFSNKMILEGETKDAKMSSFSSDFQTLTKLSWYFLYY